MAESQSPSKPQPEEMHWIALRMDVQEIRQDIRELRSEASDFRKEVNAELSDFRKEVHAEFRESRKDMAQQHGELRQDMRHGMMAMLGFSGVLATIIVAFIQYRLGGA